MAGCLRQTGPDRFVYRTHKLKSNRYRKNKISNGYLSAIKSMFFNGDV